MLLLMRNSIMTEKLARRGTSVRTEYSVDFLSQVLVSESMSAGLVMLRTGQPLREVRAWLAGGAGGATHQGFPVLDSTGSLAGVVTRRDLLGNDPDDANVADIIRRNPAVVFSDNSLRDAADHMVREGVGRLVVVARHDTMRPVGIITRSDLLTAHARRLRELDDAQRVMTRSV
jgi:chloride channel protein, CIC family